MMRIDIYDPAMCCAAGVCGPEVDPRLVQFAADAKWLGERGVVVQRHNLGQEPGAFMSNALVRRTLQTDGVGCLPLGIIDGGIVFRSGYPARADLVQLLSLEAEAV